MGFSNQTNSHQNAQAATMTSEFVNSLPASTKIHDIVNQSELYQKVLARYAATDDRYALKVSCPITDQTICHLKSDTVEELDQKIANADQVFKKWSGKTALERANAMTAFGQKIEKYRTELAQIMSIENGKNVAEAKAEIGVGPASCNWFAAEIRREGGMMIPPIHKDHAAFTIKQPVGPCGMITPWNFPSAMVTRKSFPAMAAGCSVVLKPASETPLSALALTIIAEEAGLPANLLQCTLSNNRQSTNALGEKLFSDARIKAVSFTGSTNVGKMLMNHASKTVKKHCMELGGNAPFLVFKSANIRQAVDGLISAKFRNTGQVCIAPNRILVHADVYDEFLAVLQTRMVERLRFGVPEDSKTSIGPQIYERAIPKLEDMVADCIGKGGRLVLGGKKRPDLGPCFFEPTLLADVTNEMDAFEYEIFGPIVAVGKFHDEVEGLEMANKGDHGLAAYMYSSDAGQIWRCSKQIETGMLGVNQVAISTIEYPFGGTRESGLGREGSKYGIESFTETKLINWNYSF